MLHTHKHHRLSTESLSRTTTMTLQQYIYLTLQIILSSSSCLFMLILLHGKSRVGKCSSTYQSCHLSLLTKLALPSIVKATSCICLRSAAILLHINNTNTMVTMSREPIEKSCSSKQFQYSQETIETLQNIMREVAVITCTVMRAMQ